MHRPVIVVGEVVKEAPLFGVEMVAVVVGGGCGFSASIPYESAAGAGSGIGVIALTVDAHSSVHAAIETIIQTPNSRR